MTNQIAWLENEGSNYFARIQVLFYPTINSYQTFSLCGLV